mmetsp:Transcript_32546/g.83162  ORF Transcript_32546/g.83162 Transcript_32546/m.83162 type:complete len:213 (+) Transcript_32546:667-1305(+)
MLRLIAADRLEHVVEVLQANAARAGRTLSLELIILVEVLAHVVGERNGWWWDAAQCGGVLIQKLVVAVNCMRLNELAEVVGQRGGEKPQQAEREEVYNGSVLCSEASGPCLIATQALHDEEVVHLIPLLGKVDGAHTRPAPPPAEGLVQVQHCHVGEVRHARHVLQEPEAVQWTAVEEHVDECAERQVGELEHQRAAHLLPRLLASPHRRIR